MTSNQSFNRDALNIFIALFHNDRQLRKYSAPIRKLGYSLFAIELDIFTSFGHTATPEAIAVSELQRHTLLFESTGWEEPQQGKKCQLKKFAAIDKQALVNRVAVPPDAAGDVGAWIVVPNGPKFRAGFKKWDEGQILSTFRYSKAYELKHCTGELSDAALSAIIKTGIRTMRIPSGYVKIFMSDLSQQSLKNPICIELVALANADIYRFSTEEIAERLFPNVWGLVALDQRNTIVKAIAGALERMTGAPGIRDWIMHGIDKRTWLINAPPKKTLDGFPAIVRSYAGVPVAREVTEWLFGKDDKAPDNEGNTST